MVKNGLYKNIDDVYGCLEEHSAVLQSDGYGERTIGSCMIGLGVDTMLKNDVSPVDIIKLVDMLIQRRKKQ